MFEEYGFPFSEDGYDGDLVDVDLAYDGVRGWFAVVEDSGGSVVGCVGVTDEGAGVFELHRLYLLPGHRGRGLGERLAAWAVAQARERGGTELILFSDIHFEHAHALYRRLGFACHRFRYAPDPWESREWGFQLALGSAPGGM